MQFVGSPTARPIKITIFLNCNNYRGISFPNIIIVIIIIMIIINIIIIKYMHSNYLDQSVQSDERSLIT